MANKTRKLRRARREAAQAIADRDAMAEKLSDSERRMQLIQNEWDSVCHVLRSTLPQNHLIRMLMGEVLQHRGYLPGSMMVAISEPLHRIPLTGDGGMYHLATELLHRLDVEYQEDWGRLQAVVGARFVDSSNHARIMLSEKALRAIPREALIVYLAEDLATHLKAGQPQFC